MRRPGKHLCAQHSIYRVAFELPISEVFSDTRVNNNGDISWLHGGCLSAKCSVTRRSALSKWMKMLPGLLSYHELGVFNSAEKRFARR